MNTCAISDVQRSHLVDIFIIPRFWESWFKKNVMSSTSWIRWPKRASRKDATYGHHGVWKTCHINWHKIHMFWVAQLPNLLCKTTPHKRNGHIKRITPTAPIIPMNAHGEVTPLSSWEPRANKVCYPYIICYG